VIDILLVIGVILILTRQATPLMKLFALMLGLLLAGAFVVALISGWTQLLWLILSAILIGYSLGADRWLRTLQGATTIHEAIPMLPLVRRVAMGLAAGIFLGIAGGLAAVVITLIAGSFTGSIHPVYTGGDGSVYFGNIWFFDYALFIVPAAGLIGLVTGAVGSVARNRLWASVSGASLGIATMMGLLWITYSSRAIWTDVIAFALVTAAGIGLAVSSVIAKRVGSSET
jgi:hypothetical protein